MDKLDFLDGDTPVDTTVAAPTPAEAPAETPVAEQPTTDTAPAADGRARGPDGKFVSKTGEPEQAAAPLDPATPPAAVQPDKAPEGFVPLAALEKIREELNALKRQPQQPPQPAPDPYEDFEAYREWQENQQAHERADWSRQLAEHRFGPETVSAAQQWAAERFATDPQFRERSLTSRDPYGFAIGEYQRDQALQMLSDPKLLEQFRAFQAGNVPAAQIQQQAAPAALPAPVAPPRSITSAPSAGGTAHTPTGPGQAYGSIFN